MQFLDAAFLAFTLLSLPAVLLFAAEVVMSFAPRRRDADGPRPRCTVIVPAHNEAAVLAATLASIKPQLGPEDRLLVVADNCDDDTAGIAVRHGADVARRDDPSRRGKGYALAHGVAHAAAWGKPITIVIDADCRAEEGAVAALAAAVERTGRPVQASYLMVAPEQASRGMRFSEFAIRLKNHARLLGGMRLGIPSILTGSGMAFPTSALTSLDLASGELVEDLLMGVQLARAGFHPTFCPDARITSTLPLDQGAAATQRSRWERGYPSVMRRFVWTLLVDGLRSRRPYLSRLALDLAIPPLSLLAMLVVSSVVLTGSWSLIGGGSIPIASAVLQLIVFLGAVISAYIRYGRDLLTFDEVVLLPVAVLRKLGFYKRLAGRTQDGWVRTARD